MSNIKKRRKNLIWKNHKYWKHQNIKIITSKTFKIQKKIYFYKNQQCQNYKKGYKVQVYQKKPYKFLSIKHEADALLQPPKKWKLPNNGTTIQPNKLTNNQPHNLTVPGIFKACPINFGS